MARAVPRSWMARSVAGLVTVSMPSHHTFQQTTFRSLYGLYVRVLKLISLYHQYSNQYL